VAGAVSGTALASSASDELVTEGGAAAVQADAPFLAAAILPAYLHAAQGTESLAVVAGTAILAPGATETVKHDEPAAIAAAATPRQALPAQEDKTKGIKIQWGGKVTPGQMSFGYCTYWVAKKRGNIDWFGNAAEWPAGARAAGYKMGKTPVAGAILVTSEGGYTGHVAFVESVNKDGSFVISEMNYAGWNVMSKRTLKPNFGQIVTFIY